VEFNLYLLNPDTLEYQVATDNIYSPFLIQWSPDSTQIAFIGRYGFGKENGIWLYSLNTNAVTKIAEGRFQGIVWKSDGKSLVAIRCESSDVCAQIYEYDLTHIIEP
jgi:Tol biopolymer transport system component